MNIFAWCRTSYSLRLPVCSSRGFAHAAHQLVHSQHLTVLYRLWRTSCTFTPLHVVYHWNGQNHDAVNAWEFS